MYSAFDTTASDQNGMLTFENRPSRSDESDGAGQRPLDSIAEWEKRSPSLEEKLDPDPSDESLAKSECHDDSQSAAQWDAAHFPYAHPGTGYGLLDSRNTFPEGRVVGVYFDKQRRIWRANWREGGVGKRKTKNFSVDDYGFEEARRLAIQYRLLKIMEVSDKHLNGVAGVEQMALLNVEMNKKAERKADSSTKGKRRRRYTLANHQLTKRTYGSSEGSSEWYSHAAALPAGYENWGAANPDDVYFVTRALHWQSGWGMPVGYPYLGDFGLDRVAWTPPPVTPDMCDVLDGISAGDSSRVVTARPVSSEDPGYYMRPVLTTSSSVETGDCDDDEQMFGMMQQANDAEFGTPTRDFSYMGEEPSKQGGWTPRAEGLMEASILEQPMAR
eukprot:Protomagalhaensia_sp_Gyna_25__1942@NODE_2033_length_1336_cov_19_961449_g1678_i0_p1_GENE_NODE_2033_length_1336_cov_19_961449_g1678_i0NODE_2033_length_1336_cov_19_961449_g1678_i0_p1_ORF_typecomplete_len387_score59_34AP2/PF00847_20/4_6e11AP2/PF00847_20/5_5e03_NODE_2033_length_1336_cov_19_961449_g1678_i0661226